MSKLENLVTQLKSWQMYLEAKVVNKLHLQYVNPRDFKKVVEDFNRFYRGLVSLIKSYENVKTSSLENVLNLNKELVLKGYDAPEIKEKEDLLLFADYLDENGAYGLADVAEECFKKTAAAFKNENRDYGFFPQVMGNKENCANDSEAIIPGNEGAITTRYCPDHIGVQAIRVAERTYQCPLDGKVYNYEVGYTNYKGQKVPGGSVANQTPSTFNYGGIPNRFYDSRSSALKPVH